MRSLIITLGLLIGACSIFNREGPTVTCAELQNGAVNACHDGIIATCSAGQVTFKVCELESACDRAWQTQGAFRCTESEPGVSGSDGSSGNGGRVGGSSGGSSGSSGSSSGSTGVDGGPCTAESTCVIASGGAASIALDEANVYFSDGRSEGSSVRSVPKSGGIANTLASGLKGGSGALAVDESHVYKLEAGASVIRIPKAGGGAPSEVVPASEQVSVFAIDAANVYWVGRQRVLMSVPKIGGPMTALTPPTDFGGTRLVVEGAYTYSLRQNDGSTIYRAATNASVPVAPSTIALGQDALDFAVQGNAIIFTRAADGSVWTIPLSTGAAAKLADSPSTTHTVEVGLAVNSTAAYWPDGNQIWKVARAGGQPVMVAAEFAVGLSTDEAFVFWTSGGTVKRAPK